MRIAIHTFGTRGDVQPYIALTRELLRRGHEVRLAAPEQFVSLAATHGIDLAPLPGGMLDLLDGAEAKKAITESKGFAAGFKLLKHIRPLVRELFDAEWATATRFRPEIMIGHPKSVAAPHIAETLGIPFILASPLPGFTPTKAFPSPMVPMNDLGPLNKVSHSLAANSAGLIFGGAIKAWRREALGANRPLRSKPIGTLYAYSRHVVPVPSDWGERVQTPGYWFLDRPDWTPSQNLTRFLAAGPPPVYFGFGSMPGIAPERLTALVLEALAKTGRRGLLVSGGGALKADNLPEHAMLVPEAPHDWLLPKVASTIHHGGAGTTGASLRAGKPTALCPFLGDQPFWGRRVKGLGVGPTPLDAKALTVEALTSAIVAMDGPVMRTRAAEIGEAIRLEDGVAAGADLIERWA